jgi:hypothetical protein
MTAKLRIAMMLVLGALVPNASTGGDPPRACVETGTITGRVATSDADSPLAYAIVVVVGTAFGAMTSADGTFAIQGVPVGMRTVRALMVGYEKQDKDVVVAVDGAASVSFALPWSDVGVTADKPPFEYARLAPEVLQGAGLKIATFKSCDPPHIRGGCRSGEFFVQIDGVPVCDPLAPIGRGREDHDLANDNPLLRIIDNPPSTVGFDFERLPYGNWRRFVPQSMPPPHG